MASFASRTPAEDAGIMALTPEVPKQPTAKAATTKKMMVLRMRFSSSSKLCEAQTRIKGFMFLAKERGDSTSRQRSNRTCLLHRTHGRRRHRHRNPHAPRRQA